MNYSSTAFRDTPVDYDDALHRYSHQEQTYLSATQILEHFKNKFDTKAESERMADLYGHTPQYWAAKWKGETDSSLVRGNKIHTREEEELYRKSFVEMRPVNLTVQRVPEHVAYHDLPNAIYPEMKLWRHDCRIAGRSDKVILLGTKEDRVADVEDYKTNKRIRKFGYQRRDGSIQMLTSPLTHLMDCEEVHYGLQLSLYQFMLEYHGFYPGSRRIIHFPHPIEGLGTPKPMTYNLPYYRDEVIAMIKYLQK